MSSISDSILSTLSYHSKFSYPLTLDQLHRFLLINRPVSSNEVKSELIDLTKQKKIVKKNNFYYLPNLPNLPKFPNLFSIRLKRRESSRPKLRLAAHAARLIGFLPWIKLVCVTGSLAMENSDEDDDIDLMIVTARNRLWFTRPLVILLISLFFKRRTPITNNKTTISHFANAFCLNLWLDSSALAMPPHRQNPLTAHELAQMKPLVNKDKAYEKIMLKNKWGRKYLANTWERIEGWQVGRLKKPLTFQPSNLLTFLNIFAFNLQLWYMKPKITTEEVTLHSAFFHPKVRRTPPDR